MQDWERLESSKRKEPDFVDYFSQFKLDDMRERVVKYVVRDPGLGNEEEDLDRFVVFLYDFVNRFKWKQN